MTDDLSQRLKWFSLISLTQYDDAREPQTLCAVKQPEQDASDSLNRFRSASACSTVSFASASSWCSNTSNEGAFGSPGSKKSRRKRIRRRRRSSSGSASGVMGLKVIGIGDKVAGYAYDSQLMDHKDPRGQHPECPGRLKKIVTTLKDAGLLSKCLRVPCRNASKQELQSVHTATYISKMRTMERKKDKSVNDLVNFASEEFNSVYLNTSSFRCAKLAAGCVIESVKAVTTGRCTSCFAVVRPPGHHAEAHCAMGFCIYNNVAVAAKMALQSNPSQKVLIVDWDIHHGNGTQRMFWKNSQVVYFSVHRYDNGRFYPGDAGGSPTSTGHEAAPGKTVNVGWNGKGMGDLEYKAVWQRVLMPIVQEFSPDLILVSAGFDAAIGDPLGGCKVSPAGYAWMTKSLLDFANCKVVLVLEGGYNLNSIAQSSKACLMAMVQHAEEQTSGTVIPENQVVHDVNTLENWDFVNGHELSDDLTELLPSARKSILYTLQLHSKYWRCFECDDEVQV